ncbi:MAG: hypothetical protein BZY88_20380 [SAR202 cluster bacterium Io17-Chloro-G9]|nr:MAG: hypothetical protein BZY88_20380 [SAR202 cluster bacterium Io17-Chloro-G9]
MTAATAVDPIKSMAQDQSALKAYAKRVLDEGEALSPEEEANKVYLIEEFMSLGAAFKCTKHELVSLVLKECFETPRSCDCFSCKSRQNGY